MASQTRARLNNLNDRAREFGQPDQLTLSDARAVIDHYNHTCLNCGTSPAISIDHVIPLSKGGLNQVSNLQLLCNDCNKAKGTDNTDYRQGNICPTPEPTEQSRTYRKYDWDALRFEYETNETLSLRALAQNHGIFPTLVLKRSMNEGWHKSKQKYGIELVSTAENELQQATAKQNVEREINARGLLFDVIEAAVEEWQNKPKASLGDLAQLLKLGLAAQGQTTERQQVNVSEYQDDAAIHARIHKVFDAGEEERTYTPLGPVGEEPGAGWADSL